MGFFSKNWSDQQCKFGQNLYFLLFKLSFRMYGHSNYTNLATQICRSNHSSLDLWQNQTEKVTKKPGKMTKKPQKVERLDYYTNEVGTLVQQTMESHTPIWSLVPQTKSLLH